MGQLYLAGLKLKVSKHYYKTLPMKWFAVNCIYQVICGEGKHTPQVNEQTRLIRVEDIKQALSKANLNAVHFNSSFNNCQGDKVIWKFLGVGGVSEVAKLTDGV